MKKVQKRIYKGSRRTIFLPSQHDAIVLKVQKMRKLESFSQTIQQIIEWYGLEKL